MCYASSSTGSTLRTLRAAAVSALLLLSLSSCLSVEREYRTLTPIEPPPRGYYSTNVPPVPPPPRGYYSENVPPLPPPPAQQYLDPAEVRSLLRRAYQLDLALAELSAVALDSASSGEARRYAQDAYRTYRADARNLVNIADLRGFRVASALPPRERSMVERLRSADRREFDRLYLDMVIDMQSELLRQLQSVPRTADADIQTWIENTVPLVRSDLQRAVEIRERHIS